MNYYFTIALILAVTLVTCSVMILQNENYEQCVRERIASVFLLILIGLGAEVIVELRMWPDDPILVMGIKDFASFLETLMRPAIPLASSILIFKIKPKYERVMLYGIFIIFMTVLRISLEMYLFFSFYLILDVLKFGIKYQNRKNGEIILIALLMCIGIKTQVDFPETKVFWLITTIVQILLFSYYNSTIQRNDGLTGLLNQKIYKLYLENNNHRKFSLIIFDVNYFKEINDTYGHNFGDEVLKVISKAIKKTYGKNGYCYRIGGDEFAVIIEKKCDMEELNAEFISLLEKERFKMKELPHVSYGIGTYKPGESKSITEVIEEADAHMYQYKKQFKENNENKMPR